jgi:hypothetical protein
VAELSILGTKGKKVTPDGILRNNWGLDIGYWESKDEKDVIDLLRQVCTVSVETMTIVKQME